MIAPLLAGGCWFYVLFLTISNTFSPMINILLLIIFTSMLIEECINFMDWNKATSIIINDEVMSPNRVFERLVKHGAPIKDYEGSGILIIKKGWEIKTFYNYHMLGKEYVWWRTSPIFWRV